MANGDLQKITRQIIVYLNGTTCIKAIILVYVLLIHYSWNAQGQVIGVCMYICQQKNVFSLAS